MINTSSEPWFDDFDDAKNFHQVLFKPGLAVQTRELNQLQTILRDQIKKFGNSIYKQGSVVIPGNSLSDLSVPYIKLQPTYNSSAIDVDNFLGKTVVGQTSGIEAVVKFVVASTTTDKATLYLSYIKGSSTGVIFTDGEVILLKDNTSIGATLEATSATGIGSLAFVNLGVYYVNGTFVTVLPQSVVLSKYTAVPSCRVLLKINESVVTSDDDYTLTDNAAGSYNYAAPGADRLKIQLELVTLALTETVSEDYVQLMQFVDGELVEFSRNPKYSELEKSLARRTFDESGNYVVEGMLPEIKEHLRSGTNGGVYVDGNLSKLVVETSAGKAYVNGFEIEQRASSKIVIEKARTAAHIKNTTIAMRPTFGQYLLVSNIVGYFSTYDHTTVTLYNDNDVTNVSATAIGTAKVMAVDYLIGDPTAGTAVYKLWVTNVTLTAGYTLNSVGGIKYGTYSAYAITKYSAPVSSRAYTAAETIYISTTPLTITNYIGNGTTTVTGTVASTAGYVIGESIVISGAVGTEQAKLNGTWTIANIPVGGTTFTFVVTVALTTGTLTTALGTTIKPARIAVVKYWDSTTGTLYAYKNDHTKETPNIGEMIFGGTSTTSSVITAKTTLVSVGQTGLVFRLPKPISSSLKNPTTNAYDLSYTVQKELSITTDGSGGGSAIVSGGEVLSPIETGTFQAISPTGIVQNTLFSLNVAGTTLYLVGGPLSSTVKVFANVVKTAISPKTKTVNTYSQTITSPTSVMTLDKTDIISITSIIDTVGDITNNYTVWNGQSDYSYDRGTLTLKSGKTAPSGSVTITYQYYVQSPSGDFFSINSYPAGILDGSTYYNSVSTGQLYDLPNCLDFRPSVGVDGTFTGLNAVKNDIVVSETAFTSSLQYYVPRIDILTISPSGIFSVISGTPNETPLLPSVPTGNFALNVFFIPAYTKSNLDVTSQRLDVERFTMNDIKKLSAKITKVENFATLNASELSVTTQNIKDAATGLDMFKTGYLVENFVTPLTVAKTTDGDYSATFVGNSLTCGMETLICELQYLNTSTNIKNNNGYLTLPFTETLFASQTLSSRVTNLNPFLMMKWDGILGINPASDNWTETRDLPTVFESTTEKVTVKNYIPCPPLPPLPETTYGGLYGKVIGRAAEDAGIAYWGAQDEAVTKANFNQAANATYKNYGQGAFVNEDGTKSATATEHQITKNSPLSATDLANEKYLTTTTTFAYSGRSIVATTVATDFKGIVTTTSKTI